MLLLMLMMFCFKMLRLNGVDDWVKLIHRVGIRWGWWCPINIQGSLSMTYPASDTEKEDGCFGCFSELCLDSGGRTPLSVYPSRDGQMGYRCRVVNRTRELSLHFFLKLTHQVDWLIGDSFSCGLAGQEPIGAGKHEERSWADNHRTLTAWAIIYSCSAGFS